MLTPLALWRRGETAQLALPSREFERTQFLPPEEIRRLQLARLRSLLFHASDNCPFYRRRFENAGFAPGLVHGLENLQALPPLEKQEIQANGADMIARNWPRADLIRNQTGGSTGTPVTFFLSGDRKCSRAAATLRHNRWAGWEVGDRAAVIWGASQDRPADGWRSRVRNALLREPMWLDAGCLTESRMAEFHQELHTFRPRIIQAYARAVVMFARFLRASGLTAYRPHSLVTSAEILENEDRELLEQTFGCPVYNRYGCREFSVVASECSAHSGLHVMAEGLYLEIETPTSACASCPARWARFS